MKRLQYSTLFYISIGVNLLIIIVIFLFIFVKAETKQGVNFNVYTYKIPLYLKLMGLFERDFEYKRIAKRICGTEKSEKVIVMRILDWTDKFIVKQFPESFPIYDDHIFNIIKRGYGTGDQRIDVATTLSTYAGVRAFWGYIYDNNNNKSMISYFKIDGEWRVFEPHYWSFFYTSVDELATIEDLQTHPEYIKIDNKIPMHRGKYLTTYYKHLSIFKEPEIVRPEYQMPGKRLVHGLSKPFDF